MLIELKKHKGLISKRALSDKLGVNHNSVQSWRTKYLEGGFSELLKHNKTGFKPSVISEEEHKSLEKILHTPNNGLQGYKELQKWFNKKHNRNILYITLLSYCVRHFKTKVKVARKSHVNKNQQQVETFKKTLAID